MRFGGAKTSPGGAQERKNVPKEYRNELQIDANSERNAFQNELRFQSRSGHPFELKSIFLEVAQNLENHAPV